VYTRDVRLGYRQLPWIKGCTALRRIRGDRPLSPVSSVASQWKSQIALPPQQVSHNSGETSREHSMHASLQRCDTLVAARNSCPVRLHSELSIVKSQYATLTVHSVPFFNISPLSLLSLTQIRIMFTSTKVNSSLVHCINSVGILHLPLVY
jgi:hypothetical protein